MSLRYTLEQIVSSNNMLREIYQILEDLDRRITNQPSQLRHIFAQKDHDHDKEYAKKKHTHNLDHKYARRDHTHSEYLPRNKPAYNSLHLNGRPAEDFASIRHAHSFMVLAAEATYNVQATSFTLKVKLQLTTTLDRVHILNKCLFPEVEIAEINGNLVTLQCNYTEDDIGDTHRITLLYYNINSKYLKTMLTVDDVYGVTGETVEVTSTVEDQNSNPCFDGKVWLTLDNDLENT